MNINELLQLIYYHQGDLNKDELQFLKDQIILLNDTFKNKYNKVLLK
jgi:hypothetical protein